MKHERLFYLITSIAVIISAFMKIMHIPYANSLMIFALLSAMFYQTWLVSLLKKRIKELESNNVSEGTNKNL